MSTYGDPAADFEMGQRRERRRRHRQHQSFSGGSEITTTVDGGLYLSENEEDYPSWRSSGVGGSAAAGECMFVPEMEMVQMEIGEGSEIEVVDLEMNVNVRSKKKRVKRECRICQMRLLEEGEESEIGFDLGCFCKGDMGACHKECAETWFRIKGNTTCEICGAIAMNVSIEEQQQAIIIDEAIIIDMPAAAAETAAETAVEVVMGNVELVAQNCWEGQKVMNAILICMMLALVLSWLFHFSMKTSKN